MFDNFLSVCKDVTKTARKIPQGEYLSEGAYKIFDQGKTYIGGYCNTADGLATDYPYIVFGDHTRVIKYIEEPCYIGADGVKLLKVHNNDFISKYVYYAMMANPVEHQGYSRHFKLLKESKIRKADKSMQIAIINELDKINQAISLKEFELNYINDLVKSRFIEMFGDPISNPLGWEKVALSDVAEIKIGPFGSLLHKEDYIEHGHPLVNPSHIIDSSIATDSKLTISDSKYAELSSYHLKAGDVVLGRRGEMGRCAVVKKDGMLCGTGSLIIVSDE